MDKIVNEVMIWGGGGEILIDGIRAFEEKFKEGWVEGGGNGSRVRILEGKGMAHEGFIIDIAFGFKKQKGTVDIEDWVRSKL